MSLAVFRLLRMRWLLFRNTFGHYPLRRKLAAVSGWLVILVMGGVFGVGSWSFVRLVQTPRFRQAFTASGVDISFELFIAQLPILVMTLAFMMGLLANISVLLQILYLSGDMEFLLAAPIPTRSVFLSKLFQAIFPVVLLLGALGGPALVGLGIAQSYSAGYYLLIPLFLVMLVSAGAGLAAAVVMLLVRLVSPRRAAEAIALVGGLSAFICSQSGSMMTIGDSMTSDRIADVINLAQPLTGAWNPISWAGKALVYIGEGQVLPGSLFTLGILGIASAILLGAVVAAERLYLSGWSRVVLGTRKTRKRSRSAAGRPAKVGKSRSAWLPAPVRALMRKDMLLFRRDLRNLSQLILPVIMAVIWGISFGTEGRDSLSMQSQILGGFGLFMALMMSWGFAMRFGMGAFSLEGSSWWIVKTAPTRVSHLIAAKYLVTFLPSTALGMVFVLLLSLLTGRPPGLLGYDLVTLVFAMAAISSMMLAFGIWTAKFDWKNPREVQAGGTGGCLIALVSIFVVVLIQGLFQGVPVVLTRFLNWSSIAAYIAGGACGALVCLALGVIPLAFAAGRVPRLGVD